MGSVEINCVVVGSSDIKTTEMASQNLFVTAKKDIDTTGPKETDDTNIKTTRFRSGGVYSFHKGKGHKTPARKRLVEVLQLQATEQALPTVPTSLKAEVLNAKPSGSRGQVETPAPAATVLSTPPRTQPEKSNFQWTPKDLRMIFRSNFEKRNTCMNRPSKKEKECPQIQANRQGWSQAIEIV